MIHLPASVRVYLCLTACDMRKSFDSLHALVRDQLELDAFAGHLFVFASRRRDRIKFCIGTVTDSRCGPSGWKRVHTRCRLPTIARNGGGRSRHRN
jgi:IS66 Orf2 like protein